MAAVQANGNTAAVAASNGGSAAAVALSPQDLENMPVTQAFHKNNSALKYIRDLHEDNLGRPTRNRIELTLSDPNQVRVIDHDKKGPDYTFLGEYESWFCVKCLQA